MNDDRVTADVQTRLGQVLEVHFDPRWGTPYWLERAARFDFDPRKEIRAVEDLHRLGTMDPEVLADRPLVDFLPRSMLEKHSELIVAQTGGTLGRPVWTAYSDAEFHEAFVEPFVVAARHVGFPTGSPWLYVGPSGPHIIARAADAIARATGSMSPFMVDFDAGWARKMAPGSFAADRYLRHVVDQALAVVRTQPIGVIFSTPIVIRALSEAMAPDDRERIGGIHYGGMALGAEELARLQTLVFPKAVHLSGYGNTLFGCCLELNVAVGRRLRYYPHGHRLVFGVTAQDGADQPSIEYGPTGKRGRLVFSRLDPTVLLLNVRERDAVRICEPPPDAPAVFGQPGLDSPAPMNEPDSLPPISLY
ncbi:MAG: hypothetical protein ACE5GE_03035 [Phycisphaerae bacterium]